LARRIAHEIKNPLTPIQPLRGAAESANNLREIHTDPETFLDLYGHHHPPCRGYRAGWFDEFSSFARMPAPTIKEREPARDLPSAGLPAAQTHIPTIDFEIVAPDSLAWSLPAMHGWVGQALDQSAERMRVESIQGPARASDWPSCRAAISFVRVQGDRRVNAVVAVEDNGKGLPQQGSASG